MRRRVLGFILLLFITASLLAIDNRYPTVYVYRPSRLLGIARSPSVYIDGVEVGRLHNGTYLKFEAAPGQHLITSATYVEGSQYLNFESGKEYFFQVKVGSMAKAAVGGPSMKLLKVPQQQALREIEKLKVGDANQPPTPQSP